MLTFNVVLLGPSGAGKSVFLSLMNEKIKSQRFSDDFFVQVDPATKNRLSSIYRAILDTSRKWPSSNHCDDMIELSFTGCLDDKPEPLKLYEIRYLDYDGRCLTDQKADSRIKNRLVEKIEQADALLCILDGRYIAALLNNEPAGRDFFDHDMAAVWSDASVGDGPLHFVITKWDLVEPYGNLEDVRNALMEVPGFASVVRCTLDTAIGSGGRRIIRLIPVSVVGRSFAVLGSDDSVAEISSSTDSPLNADIPFLAVLPDVLKTAVQEVEKNFRRSESLRFLKGIQAAWLVQFLAEVGARRSLQNILINSPDWVGGALCKLGRFVRGRGRDRMGEWIVNRGNRINVGSIKYADSVASALVLLATVTIEALKNGSSEPVDLDKLRRYSASLDQATRAYELELDRFRESYPASHLTDLDSVHSTRPL